MTDPRTLYLVVSGGTAPHEPMTDLVALLREEGWQLTALSTPMGTRFHDVERIAEIIGEPVRVDFRMPGTGQRLPPPEVVLACPLSFNSVNKFAQGIADNFAVALLCEMIGYNVPTVVVPKASPPLSTHPAFRTSLDTLRSIPSVRLLYDPEVRIPTWRQVADTVRSAVEHDIL